MNYPSYLIVLSAPSGAGKSTLCRKLLPEFPKLRLSISCTTRLPRGTEQHGKDYFFLAPSEFQKGIQEGQFVEWALVHGNYYGTSKQMIQDCLQRDESVLLDIDVQGAQQLKQAFGDRCFLIFIAPPSLPELESRLRSRGTDSEETIQRRLNNAKTELEQGKDFDYLLMNDSLDRAFAELKRILKERLHLKGS